MDIKEWLCDNDLSLTIWEKKYRNGNETFDEWLDRVSHGYEPVKKLIKEKKFLFGGRILASRGIKNRKVTYSNCYVISPPTDHIESIFECSSKLARTYSYGGGCGIDISKLRPNGAIVHNASKTSSGPVSFMDMFSQITQTISQNGRRGALMISMDVNHPDILEFVNCKTDLERVKYANISVRVNDEFMKAVENDDDYWLRYPCDFDITGIINTLSDKVKYGELIKFGEDLNQPCGQYLKKIKARDLFNRIVENNWDYAEPGILYWDRVKNYNILNNTDFEFAGVNPCSEEPLSAGSSCLLGSINLSEFVEKPFTKYAKINYDELESAVNIAIVGLNQVLIEGMDLHPLKEQRESVKNWRSIGLGTMGLADMFIKLGIKYGSKDSLDITEEVYKTIAKMAIMSSLELAKSHGCYPNCEKEKLKDSSFIKHLNLPEAILNDLDKYGLYNNQILTVPPCGSIATMISVSTGLEPIFAMKYTRKTQSLEGKDKIFDVYTKIADDYLKKNNTNVLPDYFVEAKDVDPLDKIKLLSIIQSYVDASLSTTTNMPNEATKQDVYNVYINAWKYGLKGVTIYRAGCKREGILVSTSTSKPKEEVKQPIQKFNYIQPISRKQIGTTYGATYSKQSSCGRLYITINKDDKGNIVELFTHTSKGGICQANLNALTRSVSLNLRSGVVLSEIIDQLKGIYCPACAALKAKGKKVDGLSCPDILSKTLADFVNQKNNNDKDKDKEIPVKIEKKIIEDVKEETTPFSICPECGEKLNHNGGCVSCTNCGFSKCD